MKLAMMICALAMACVDKLPTTSMPCPCAAGWFCDKSAGDLGVCVNAPLDAGVPDQSEVLDMAGSTGEGGGKCRWGAVNTGETGDWWTAWGTGSMDVFIAGGNGLVMHSDGKTWKKQPTGVPNGWITGLWGTSKTNMHATAVDGLLYHFDGKVWTTSQYVISGMWDLWGTGQNEIYACGNAARLERFDGSNWKTISIGTTSHLNGIWGTDKSNIYAVGGPEYYGGTGTIIHYDGKAWKTQLSGSHKHLYDIWGSGPKDIYAVGLGGTILRYDGSTWKAMASGVTSELRQVWGSGPGNVYIVGEQVVT